MKKIRIAENVIMVGVINDDNGKWTISYYFDIPRRGKIYVFTGPYKEIRYNLVKDGIRVNELLAIKTKSDPVMKLVEQTRRFIPYMVKEYGIPVAA